MALGGKLQEALAGSLRHGGGCSVAGKGARKAPDSGIAFARNVPSGRQAAEAEPRARLPQGSSWSFTNVLESDDSELGR